VSCEWDFLKLISQLPPHCHSITHMIECIRACRPLMPDDIEDIIAWKAASDGAFSTANACNSILQVQNTCNTNVFCWVWKWKNQNE